MRLSKAIAIAALVTAAGAPAVLAQTYTWNFTLDGPSEAPPNASPGIGAVTLTFNTSAQTLRVQATFSGLVGTTTVAHIHAAVGMTPFTGTAGVASQVPTYVGFPVGVTSGSYDATFDLTLSSSWNPAFITANGGTTASASDALLFTLNTGRAYFNLHSSAFPGGEIRGFAPTPGAAGLLALGGLVAGRRRRGA